ncbi:hypothetical protein [Galbibacter sp. PAP.153]
MKIKDFIKREKKNWLEFMEGDYRLFSRFIWWFRNKIKELANRNTTKD